MDAAGEQHGAGGTHLGEVRQCLGDSLSQPEHSGLQSPLALLGGSLHSLCVSALPSPEQALLGTSKGP